MAIVLWLCASPWAAWGQEPPAPLAHEVHTYPPGATLTDFAGNQIGQADGPEPVLFPNYGGEYVELVLSLPEHKSKTVSVRTDQVSNLAKSFEGVITLEADNGFVAAKDFVRYNLRWLMAGFAVLAAGSLGLLLFVRGLKRRALTVEERQQTIDSYGQDASKVASLFSERIGEYVLVDRLGEGGMAAVYRALPWHSMDPQDAVAIKVISRQLAGDDQFNARFQREADICRTLSHPNIVRLIDWGTKDDRFYLVLEFVDGSTLKGMLATGSLTVARRRELLMALCQAMVYAHNKGIVHRDLKPENLMVTRQGTLKVMDFGLARGQGSDKLTQTGTAMGTPAYMAPEQVTGGAVDHRTDQYAMGMIAYEMLAGRLPFDSDEVIGLLYQQMSVTPAPPSEYNPDLPDEVDAVILRMLAKSPAERYSTTEDATFQLSLAMEGYR